MTIANEWGQTTEASQVYVIDVATRRTTILPIYQWAGAHTGPTSQQRHGTNLPSWTPDGKLLMQQLIPSNGHSPFTSNTDKHIDDHFDCHYIQGNGKGCTMLMICDPRDFSLAPGVRDGLIAMWSDNVWFTNATATSAGLVYRSWVDNGPETPAYLHIGDHIMSAPLRFCVVRTTL